MKRMKNCRPNIHPCKISGIIDVTNYCWKFVKLFIRHYLKDLRQVSYSNLTGRWVMIRNALICYFQVSPGGLINIFISWYAKFRMFHQIYGLLRLDVMHSLNLFLLLKRLFMYDIANFEGYSGLTDIKLWTGSQFKL